MRKGPVMSEKEILVVSFGSSFAEARKTDIGGIEEALARAYPDYRIARAFSSPRVIRHMHREDQEQVDSVSQALEGALAAGIKELILQPTYLMHGIEYELMIRILSGYRDRFVSVAVGQPLLGERDQNPAHYTEDMVRVSRALLENAWKESGLLNRDPGQDPVDKADKGPALVLMGHGTEHGAHIVYQQFQSLFSDQGRKDVFVATVDGDCPETNIHNILSEVQREGFKHVILRPLMVVAGDHANNDMAGDREDSWKNLFAATGSFEEIECQLGGLGRLEKIQQIYVDHAAAVM